MSNPSNGRAKLASHVFLKDMIDDAYFPRELVAKGQALLLALCSQMDAKQPTTEDEVLALTDATTEGFNELANEFEELETAARDAIASDVELIVRSYGFSIDRETAVRRREW